MREQSLRGSIVVLGMAGLSTLTGYALASGVQLTEQSVTGLGRAFAGGSLPNDDASAAYFNPADMMLGNGIQAQVGMTIIGITAKADNAGSRIRLPANLTDVLTQPSGTVVPVFVTVSSRGSNDDGGTDNFVPNGYYTMDIDDRMRFGLSLTTPFAVSTGYGQGWVGRYHALDSELFTVDINPSLAYRVNDHFSVGGGVSAQYTEAKLTQALFNPFSPTTDGYGKLKGDDWGFGFNVGATYEFDADTRVGLSYRSRVEYTLEGDRTITHWISGRNGETPARVDWTAPDWLLLTAYRRLNDQWAVMGGVRWTDWSLFQELRIQYADGSETLTEEKWDDTWTFNIGVSYDYNPAWTFRAGYQYDQTPVRLAEYRTPRIPDSDRNAFAVGFSYRPNPRLSLDFGYMYLLFDDSRVNNTIDLLPAPVPTGLVTDTLLLDYNSYGNLIGLQASYKF